MVFPFLIVLLCLFFGLQLLFCFQIKQRWLRLAPPILTVLADAVCWVLYFGGAYAEVFGAAFTYYIYGIVLLLIFMAELLALGMFAIVKCIQKRRK